MRIAKKEQGLENHELSKNDANVDILMKILIMSLNQIMPDIRGLI